MSEDSSFNLKKKEEDRLAPDFFGSLGKGMLAKENLEILGYSSGLTPLSFDATTEFTENTELLKNSSGLTPLRPFVKKHKKEVLE